MNLYFVIVFQQLIAAGTHLIAKTVTQQVDPVLLTFIRNCVSLLAMLVMFFVREKRVKVEKSDLKHLLWLSFLAVPMNQFLYLYGIKFTLASNGALLYAMTPALVLVLSYFILKESMTKTKTAGIIIAFAGISIVVFEKGVDFSSDYAYGNLMIFCAVIAWALFAIQGKQLVKKYGAFHITVLSMIGGAVMFLPVGLFRITVYGIPEISIAHWGGILYLSIGTSVVSYILWFYALGRMDTAKVAVFANAQPILTTILAVIFLSQPVTTAFLIGGTITIGGVLLTQRK
ncbi:MAG: DMT family transporter [Bacteriovoracaceae bacterium]|nr:DMT family transporter [Bacteroidota bacterium]